MDNKRYVVCVLLLTVFLLCLISVLNFKLDPGNIYGNNQFIEECGRFLLDGNDIATAESFENRLLTKYLIEHDNSHYDVIVLGSSRSAGIGKELFTEVTMKNYSVPGASLEDDIALYFMYEKIHGVPKKIVIALDAWIFNRNNGLKQWKTLMDGYLLGKKKLNRIGGYNKEVGFEKYEQMITWPYFSASIQKIKRNILGESERFCVVTNQNEVPSNAIIYCSDGSWIFSVAQNTNNAEVAARKYITGDIYSLERYDTLDEDLREEFQAFFSYLNGKGIEIVLYLTPYHPIVYSYLVCTEKYWQVTEVENYFRKYAEDNQFTVIGSFNPERCDLSGADFTDGVHLRREAMYRIMEGKI